MDLVEELVRERARAEAAEQVVRGLGVGLTLLRQLHEPQPAGLGALPLCPSCGLDWPCPSATHLYTEAEVAGIYRDPLREALADYAHEAWAGWMGYLFRLSRRVPEDGTIVIPADLVSRWERQRLTPYPELPAEEQESDRQEADRMLGILRQFGGERP